MQNKFFNSLIFAGITGIICLVSCTKKIDEAYANPNAGVRQPVESILPGVIGGFTWFSSTQGTAFGTIVDGSLIGRYIQYWGINTSADTWGQMSMLGGVADNGGSLWGTVYYGQGENVNKIIKWGTEEEKWDYVGAALAIRAWGWLELTQEYDIGILKEAWTPGLSSFHYDNSEEIFDSCRAVCHRAISFLNRKDGKVSQANLAIGDKYFCNGDVLKWKKFVFGILARSYNDLSIKSIYTSRSYADSAIKYADSAMITNLDNATVKVAGGTQTGFNNWWGPFRGNIGSYRQGEYIARLMNGDDTTAFAGVTDPRAWYILSENNNKTFKGLKPWLGNATLTADYPKNFWRHPTPTSTTSPTVDSTRYLYSNTSPWPMMTASEMQFIKAEAALRKGDKNLALSAYINGISLNFDMLTSDYPQNIPAGKQITPAIKTAYLSNATNPLVIPATSAGLTLTHIMNQKYIALYVWGTHETWVDMRKFHYTDTDPETNKKVYAGFTPPSGNNLIATNLGNYTYRMRPRFNSEYLYDIPELTRIGAYQFPEYNTYKTWFAIP